MRLTTIPKKGRAELGKPRNVTLARCRARENAKTHKPESQIKLDKKVQRATWQHIIGLEGGSKAEQQMTGDKLNYSMEQGMQEMEHHHDQTANKAPLDQKEEMATWAKPPKTRIECNETPIFEWAPVAPW